MGIVIASHQLGLWWWGAPAASSRSPTELPACSGSSTGPFTASTLASVQEGAFYHNSPQLLQLLQLPQFLETCLLFANPPPKWSSNSKIRDTGVFYLNLNFPNIQSPENAAQRPFLEVGPKKRILPQLPQFRNCGNCGKPRFSRNCGSCYLNQRLIFSKPEKIGNKNSATVGKSILAREKIKNLIFWWIFDGFREKDNA